MCKEIKIAEEWLRKEGLVNDGEVLLAVNAHRSGRWDCDVLIGSEVVTRWLGYEEGKANPSIQEEYAGKAYPQVVEVADRFLRRKATIGELRSAVKAAKGE